MSLLGDLAKGFVIFTVAYWIFAIICSIAAGQMGIALLLLLGLVIPLSMIAHEYLKSRKKEKT